MESLHKSKLQIEIARAEHRLVAMAEKSIVQSIVFSFPIILNLILHLCIFDLFGHFNLF